MAHQASRTRTTRSLEATTADAPVADGIIDAITIDGLKVEFSNRVALAPVDLIEEAAAGQQPIHVELTRSRR